MRLYFVAGEKARKILNEESNILNKLTDMWGTEQKYLLQTADRIFKDYKKYNTLYEDQKKQMFALQMRAILQGQD